MKNKKYWENIDKIQKEQTEKGINKYGMILEENDNLDYLDRIRYLQEELIDALMYCEHLKEDIKGMRGNEYQKLALRTLNKEFSKDPTNQLINGILGIMGESGEMADHIKKHRYQGHSLNKEYLAEELGDVCWYISLLSNSLGYDLETIMEMNIKKLKKRYPQGFEVEKSLNRRDE